MLCKKCGHKFERDVYEADQTCPICKAEGVTVEEINEVTTDGWTLEEHTTENKDSEA